MLANLPTRPVIAVSDREQAKTFYGDKLGLKLVKEDPGGMTFECGQGTHLEVYQTEFAGTARNTVAGFEVADLDAEMSELRQRGVEFENYDSPSVKTDNGVATIGPNRGAWFKDPDGNTFGLIQVG